MKRNIAWHWSAQMAGFALLAIFSALYTFDQNLYFLILKTMGFDPFLHPFVDGEYIVSGVECWKKNIDVYVANPCDILHRPNAYSPLWLRATFLPADRRWINPLGLGLAIAFLTSLFLLPKAKSGFETMVLTLATISTMTVFAIERANIDLVMFLLAMLAALGFTHGRRARLLAYGPVLLAGFLKFYPLVLFVFSFAERPRKFLGINILAGLACALFIWWFLPELAEMAPNIPRGPYFTDAFGAVNLPYGLCQIFFAVTGFDGANAPWARHLPTLTLLLLVADTARRAVTLSQESGFDRSLSRLPDWDRTLLVTGCVLICGCFFAGQSIEYRGIHFLFILPGLLALTRGDEASGLGRHTVVMILFLMWGECLRQLIALGAGSLGLREMPAVAIDLGFRLFRELVWWRVISRLGAILIWFVRTSDTGEWALAVLRRTRQGAR